MKMVNTFFQTFLYNYYAIQFRQFQVHRLIQTSTLDLIQHDGSCVTWHTGNQSFTNVASAIECRQISSISRDLQNLTRMSATDESLGLYHGTGISKTQFSKFFGKVLLRNVSVVHLFHFRSVLSYFLFNLWDWRLCVEVVLYKKYFRKLYNFGRYYHNFTQAFEGISYITPS